MMARGFGTGTFRTIVQKLGAGRRKVSNLQISQVFPFILIACNLCAAVAYVCAGDWKRAIYWAASSVCVLAITV